MSKIIDTHCHLDSGDYDNIDLVIDKMKNDYIIACGYNFETNNNVIELINKYDNIYGTIGFHPDEVDNLTEEDLNELEEMAKHSKIVGIGEIGLDYHYTELNKDKQKDYFIKQIKIAQNLNKTIVIHSRDSIEDTYQILDEYLGTTKAVLHCYSSTKEMAHKFLKFNMMFGIGGVLTFKNGRVLKEMVEEIDISYLLLETDSPYLTPEPYRGLRNEPVNVKIVASKLSELKKIDVDEVIKLTTNNAIKQFDLPI